MQSKSTAMNNAMNLPASMTPSRKHRHGNRERAARSLARRMKVAGLDGNEIPDDADEFRRQLTRRISMFVNRWHGCPELLCARNRGCMAPNDLCANAPQVPDEERARNWPQVQAEVYNALKEHLAVHGVDGE